MKEHSCHINRTSARLTNHRANRIPPSQAGPGRAEDGLRCASDPTGRTNQRATLQPFLPDPALAAPGLFSPCQPGFDSRDRMARIESESLLPRAFSMPTPSSPGRASASRCRRVCRAGTAGELASLRQPLDAPTRPPPGAPKTFSSSKPLKVSRREWPSPEKVKFLHKSC